MTLADVSDLLNYWQKVPPAHIMLARLLAVVSAAAGVDTSTTPTPSAKEVLGASSQQGSIEDLLSLFPSGTISAA